MEHDGDHNETLEYANLAYHIGVYRAMFSITRQNPIRRENQFGSELNPIST